MDATNAAMSLEQDISASMERAMLFGSFMDRLCAPTPAQLWLEQAAAELQRQRDPDGQKTKRRDRCVIEVMERDGSDCWFCAKPLNGDVTLEHLQPLALGGKWDLENLALAHTGCNKSAGHLPRFKKELLREQMIASRDLAGFDEAMREFRKIAGVAAEEAAALSPFGSGQSSLSRRSRATAANARGEP